ncbi:MAG TPA: hypothetical protein VF595_03345 [Tepidisphaeraceae bacterium]
MFLEPLETRRLFAGTITFDTTGDEIVIRGDSKNNNLIVESAYDEGGEATGGYVITSTERDASTLVVDGVIQPSNRISIRYVFGTPDSPFLAKSWRVEMGDGDDSYQFTSQAAILTMAVDLGGGDDYYYQYGRVSQSLSFSAGAGDDAVGISYLDEGALRNATFDLGLGRDRLTMMSRPGSSTRVPVPGRLQILDTSGPSKVLLRNVDVSRQTQIITGNSIDRVTLDNCSFKGPVAVATHGGRDVLTGTFNRFRAGGFVSPGPGRDTVDGLEELLG